MSLSAAVEWYQKQAPETGQRVITVRVLS